MANPGDHYWKELQALGTAVGPEPVQALLHTVGAQLNRVREDLELASHNVPFDKQAYSHLMGQFMAHNATMYGLCRLSEHMWRQEQRAGDGDGQ